MQTTVDPVKYETTLTITGAGGFGKTTIVTYLCYYHPVKEYFTDGFVFVELGPQATDPSIKLSQLYHLLTGEYLKPGDINHAEQEIKQLTSKMFHNLLVIIDDVWHFEDAIPLLKAFSSCKTILTTRMNDFEQYVPSKQSITVGSMTQNEAISLLTKGLIFIHELSQEDLSSLEELAQDSHLFPLLLSLIKGQLSHYLKLHHFSSHEAIKRVRAELNLKGLTVLDKNTISNTAESCKLAVKACIELSLQLLTKSLSDKIKSLILWTGIGTSLQREVLHNLWNISEQEAGHIAYELWAYGLVKFSDVTISPVNITQACVEVHAIISQYIIESMDCQEVYNLSPVIKYKIAWSIERGLSRVFMQSYGVSDHDLSLLSVEKFLKFKLSELESVGIPYCFKSINVSTVSQPHEIILILQLLIQKMSIFSSKNEYIGKEFDSLCTDCKHLLNGAHILCRKLNQNVQRNLYEKNYQKLIQTVEEFNQVYPFYKVAQKSISLLKKIMPYWDDIEAEHTMVKIHEHLQMLTLDYHKITTLTIPYIKLFVEKHKEITSALLNGIPDTELIYQYFMSGKLNEEIDLIKTCRLIKLQEIAPNYVNNEILK